MVHLLGVIHYVKYRCSNLHNGLVHYLWYIKWSDL